MLETHPFGDFVPNKVKFVMIGSFVTKPSNPYDWFYANGRNQFWPIMEAVYTKTFNTKQKQQQLFIDLEMALTDIILSCERLKNSNLDVNLFNITYNIEGINTILSQNSIEKVYLTSKNVEKMFRKQFKDTLILKPGLKIIDLPSPSPRYAIITKQEKIKRYKELLPKL